MKITLKAARINKGYTQHEAGRIIGVSRDTISKWERNECVPNIKYISAIERAYGVKYDNLIFLPSDYALSVESRKTFDA
uniref:Helix-turn-helix XRE-family like protein n=1 Tax=Caudovirales sp. ct1Jx6 TaxID=2826765 RepID=A0A8S5MLB7_9CAUD|nr:MAG TPA: helix-turn-helix XRE-family like protein [Caudovirales sp. ct1Jx6]